MCLDDQILNTYIDDELAEPWKSQVAEHLSYCKACSNRYEELAGLRKIVRESALTDEEIRPRQDRVLAVIEKNCLNRKKKRIYSDRKIQISVPALMGMAAAFVFVFVGGWAVLGHGENGGIITPENGIGFSIDNITPVRASDSSTAGKSIESYSLDDILKSLDARGYDVDIRLKSIKPVSFGISSDVEVVLEREDGLTVTSDGYARSADGTILATGVSVDGDDIVASDGSKLQF